MSFNQIMINTSINHAYTPLIRLYMFHSLLKSPSSHYSQREKTHLSSKPLFFILNFLLKTAKNSSLVWFCHHIPSFFELQQTPYHNCKQEKGTVSSRTHSWQIWIEAIPRIVEPQVTIHSSSKAYLSICFEQTQQNNNCITTALQIK